MNCCSCNDIVGYRFHPTDKELIDHYLWNKALDRDSAVQAIGEIKGDLCDWEPGELPRFSIRRSNDQTWYLFSRRNHCKRIKRTTKLGYWKLTGKHRRIKANVGVGTKKTLVFYEGRVPKGKWTPWVIHEYTLPDTLLNQNGFFLCKLKKKDDAKAGILSDQEGQPSNVVDNTSFDNSLDINVDELLAMFEETDGNDKLEADDEVASAQKSRMYGELVTSCNALSIFYNTGDDFDGVHNQSSTNEQDDEIQHQPSTIEQEFEIQHQPSTIEQDDEYWNYILVEDNTYIDERINELFVGSESSNFLTGRNIPVESSRKRPRIDDGGSPEVTQTEESQAQYR